MTTSCFSLCRCYPSITNVVASLSSSQAFIELHRTFFEPWRCQWFKQATEILQSQQAIDNAIFEVSKQLTIEQARTAEATRLNHVAYSDTLAHSEIIMPTSELNGGRFTRGVQVMVFAGIYTTTRYLEYVAFQVASNID